MTNEKDLLQQIEEGIKDDETLEGLEDAQEGEKQPEPDPVATLKQEYDAQIADLRRSVGRVQSLASKFEKDQENDKTADELREQFKDTSEQLDLLVNGLDETMIDPDTRGRLVEARLRARAVAERDSLRKELLDELRPAPQQQPDMAQLAVLYERQLIGEIESYGMDPTDEVFDWKQAGALFQRGDYEGMQRYVRTQIREGLTATDSESRRQAKKESGNATPRPQGAGKSRFEKILEDGDIENLDDATAELESLGITV